ncbi:MAG: DNA replication/repair protein RecF [Clostridia bacterium]|nr:DNA replication/repair protein RecF [Clostridia bacterium]
MNVNSIHISNYRNIGEMELFPYKGVNVIFGENAQGKTNLLESIWLFSGFRSFRGSKDNELIKFGEDYLKSEIDFYGAGREQSAKIVISRQSKKILLNSVPVTAASRLIGNFNCVVFSPAYLSLVKGSPSERRRFIDSAICQIKPSYTKSISDYNKVLVQRNSFLKDLKFNNSSYDFLEIWNQKLAQLAAVIINERISYIKRLSATASDIYLGLSGEKEQMDIEYKMRVSSNRYESVSENVDAEHIEKLLKQSENSDIMYGSTNIGAHHDEIDIKIDNMSAKSFGSQGQQRSAALALKLGEAEILKEITGERPVALLDDVMSELDVNRQDYILNHIKDWQVFITCCEPSTVLRLCEGKTFEISNGRLK